VPDQEAQLEISDIAKTPAICGDHFCRNVATEFLFMEIDALFIRHILLSSVGDNASREGHATLAVTTTGQAAFPISVRGSVDDSPI
jgi:hypothetical protein